MGQVGTRKRPAPGTSPRAPQHQNIRDGAAASTTLSQDLSGGWQSQEPSTGAMNYPDPNLYGGQPQPSFRMSPIPQDPSANQLMRRNPNQPVVAQLQTYANAGNGAWSTQDESGQIATDEGWPMQYDDLDQRAVVAKRDAQSKRKQIPPFVQKLSSFLDESRNTDLIRWSDSGNSFIVVDEDEFAKTLIPELFKHNNYASFVRQLNMYGFHKKVGLSDNSMRASERKNKNPSEYSNPYFKRGRPNLLWLIQKPKNPTGKGGGKGGRTKHEDYDEEVDETFVRDNSPMPPNQEQLDDANGMRNGRQPLLTMGNLANRLPRDDLAEIQREFASIRHNQHLISEMLQRTRKEHQQLIGQAKAFHELHEKHDNSINAILTFLATVYNKNLASGQGGMGNMFPGSIPANDQESGNVVEMGDVKDQSPIETAPRPTFRRGPLLIEDAKRSPSIPRSPGKKFPKSKTKSTRNTKLQYTPNETCIVSPTIHELSDRSSESPPLKPDKTPSDSAAQTPQADIMSMLNSATAHNSTFPSARMDFSEALSHLQNSGGQSPLTPHQRQNMLQLMDNEYKPPIPTTTTATNTITSHQQQQQQQQQQNQQTNLSFPFSPPLFPSASDLASPIDRTTADLNSIGQAIRDQNASINNLSNTLTPLSPSGSIPGVPPDYNNNNNLQSMPGGAGGSGDLLDLDNIFNTDYFNDDPSGAIGTPSFGGEDLPDFDFGGGGAVFGAGDGNDGAAMWDGGLDMSNGAVGLGGSSAVEDGMGLGGTVETEGSSLAASPAGTVATVATGEDGEVVGVGVGEREGREGREGSPGKRRRRE